MDERSSLRAAATSNGVVLRYTTTATAAVSSDDENVLYSIAHSNGSVRDGGGGGGGGGAGSGKKVSTVSVNTDPSDRKRQHQGVEAEEEGHWMTTEEELMAKRNVQHPTSTNTASLDLAETTRYSFATGPSNLRKFSETSRFVTNFFLCVTQLGFCCVYLVFVSNNIKDIVDRNSPSGPHLDYRVYMAIILVPIILTNLLRNLKFLSPASTIANLLQIVSLCLIFYFVCRDIPPVTSRPQFASFKTLPLWFGTVIFSFEGIGLVLPLENSMKRPSDFGGLTGVLNTSMVIVSCMYIAVGFYGYLKYGDKVLGSITLNLPNDILADVVRGAYAAAIFLTYAVQFFVPVQVMWPDIQRRLPTKYHYVGEVTFRISIVLITFALASLIPQLGLFISLVGAFSGSYISVILPPVLELVTFWNDGITTTTIIKDVFIFIVGILGCITGTYFSIEQIVTTFGNYS